ncbi:MAG: N-acetylmuramoyl-L-alanine amidase [Bacteriovoracaceae bacterium]|nr:N-acetylmuramoyl-L-alanine amidase [Bacteriovoracaceae bacterium]
MLEAQEAQEAQDKDFLIFEQYQKTQTADQLIQKLNKYLLKNYLSSPLLDLTEERFILKDVSGAITFQLDLIPQENEDKLQEFSIKENYKKPLRGFKIALDPGHFGGKLAKTEGKYIEFEEEGVKYCFAEGDLTLMTAFFLERFLKKAGAEVLMTKKNVGDCAYQDSYKKWKRQNKTLVDKYEKEWSLLNKEFFPLDYAARAQKINEFEPDLSIVIHYDVSANRPEQTTTKNSLMFYIPGSFLAGELSTEEEQYEFLRLLLTDDILKSHKLAKKITDSFKKSFPAVPLINHAMKNTIFIERGILARNLALTRMIHGPLVYGETFYQDNNEICAELDKKNKCIKWLWGPAKTKEVAQAYFKGILNYFLQ